MQTNCIACNERYFYREGDDDCTKVICSFCFGADRNKMQGKWARLRFKILERDLFSCRYCGDSPLRSNDCILHVDHIEPYSKSFCNSEKNLISACAKCNMGKMAIELGRESKKEVEKYIESKGDYDYESSSFTQETRSDKVGDCKKDECFMADSPHVGQGNVQTKRTKSKRT